MDKDGNGLIDFEEFKDAMQGIIKESNNEDDIKGAYRLVLLTLPYTTIKNIFKGFLTKMAKVLLR